LQPWMETGALGPDAAAGLRADPLAYGVKATRPTLEAIAQFVHEQGLTDRRVAIDEVFAKSTLDV